MSQLLQVATRTGNITASDGTAFPAFFDQGIPYDAVDEIAVDVGGTIDHYHQGLSFTANSRVVATVADPVRFNSGGMPIAADGGICMKVESVDHHSAGIPYNIAGSITVLGLLVGITFFMLQEDNSDRMILEDGSGFMLTEDAP